MNDRCNWQVHTTPVAGKATGEVSVFQVKEVALVKAAGAAEGLATDEHAATTQVGRVENLLIILIRHDIPAVIALQPTGLKPIGQEASAEQPQDRRVALA